MASNFTEVVISASPLASVSERIHQPTQSWVAKLSHRIQLKLRRKAIRRRFFAAGIISINVIVIGAIVAFVLLGSKTGSANSTTVASSALSLDSSESSPVAANPVDQVSSADIALTVAQVSSLPEATAISNQAQSAAVDNSITLSSNDVINKPQILADVVKSNADITSYTTVAGDTLASLAAKFGVTSNSIIWSNNLTASDTINPGTSLLIPPVNGIVYTVQSGDTPATLAARFKASADKIIAYNDAEISGLTVGERIIIPDATQSASTSAANVVSGGGSSASAANVAWGSGPIYGINGYDYGYCTWYVATQISVPGNWGNASTWAYYAALSGWNVSKTPSVGAIAQIGGRIADGEGHVAIVDAVSPDGTQIQYRDMNGLAGWGRVGYSGWVPASFFDNYITH